VTVPAAGSTATWANTVGFVRAQDAGADYTSEVELTNEPVGERDTRPQVAAEVLGFDDPRWATHGLESR
jgi:hypothetical protein